MDHKCSGGNCRICRITTNDVYYSGRFLSPLTINTGDNLTSVIQSINSYIRDSASFDSSKFELKINRVTNLNTPNNTTYPTTKAVADAIAAIDVGCQTKKITITMVDYMELLQREFLIGSDIIQLFLDNVPLMDIRDYQFDIIQGRLTFTDIGGLYPSSKLKIVYEVCSGSQGGGMPPDCECLSTDDVTSIIYNYTEWVEKTW